MCTKNKCVESVESLEEKTTAELLRVKRQLERLNMQELNRHGDASASLTQTSASSAELFLAFKAGKREGGALAALVRGMRPSITIRKEIVDQDNNMVKKLSSSKGRSSPPYLSPMVSKGRVNEATLAATRRMANHKIKFADAIKARDVNRMQTELLALFKQNVDQGFVRIVQPAPHEERHCEPTAAQHRWAKGSDDGGGFHLSACLVASACVS
ncbi:hypothetical protein T484DRAFT_1824356 [Baffinella frigidus]|nr:hypothetical protein T484DRAFT_1824356 [Cryptophyta sp. CCMP2293]